MMRYEREIFAATLAICILSAMAYWHFYHEPLERELLQMELSRQQISKQAVDIINFKNKNGDLDDVMVALDEQYEELERALPPKLFQGEFINYLQSTALTHQIQLKALTPGTVARDENLSVMRLPLRAQVECTYFKLLDFLKALEASERLIQIENFTVKSKGDGEILICELELILFSMAEGDDANAEISDGG